VVENAAGVFATAGKKQSAMPDLKELHAKIGQQALELKFLVGALGRVGDAHKTMINKAHELSVTRQAT